ncbi:hypothetical protein LZ30DRAFT_736874 [Colletotrichum cereale]|nr:hypothetical protein LZ30DRAFT_736874 [Colletotrichum cereale]
MWDVHFAEKKCSTTLTKQPIKLHGQDPPSGDDVLLLPNRVFAFILRTRKWACLPLTSGILDNQPYSLTRMNEDHEAWDSLQIDDGHRAIIKSLMATHFRKKKSERRQFDIIQDKGKGLIILLHGVPGVGKTSTAETVAQYYNKPLLPITCGDLGTTPAEVENNLQSSFQMAQAWDCVLMPYGGGQAGAATMAGGVAYGNNMQNQAAFLANQGWQAGGYGGVSNTGLGGLNMAGPSTGTSGGGNGMGAGLSPGSVNVQVLPGHSIQGQMNNPQQQQQQQPGSSMGPGGPMAPGYR